MNRNKILLIVFGLLLAIYLGNKFLVGSNDRNYKKLLVTLDTASVNKVVITSKQANLPIAIEKKEAGWTVSNGDVSDNADEMNIKSILTSMVNLKPQRLVANSPEKWIDYQVGDSLGTRVEYYNEDEKLADIMIGKFSFNQAARTAATFVRLFEEDEVYTVDGFLSSTFSQEFNNFRDKTFLDIEPADITSIEYTYPADSGFLLSKVAEGWQIEGVSADSASVQKFVNGLRKINQREFADNFSASSEASYFMTIQDNNMNAIEIKGFIEGNDIVLNSSQNPDAYFYTGSFKPFEKLFISSASLSQKE